MRPLQFCRAAALFAPGLLLLAFAPVSLGASFFISSSGKDTNRCTNQTTDACSTFPRCAAVMAAGDTCFALDGTYLVTDTDPASPRMGWVFRSPGGTRTARKRFTSLSQDARKVTIKSATPRTQNTYYLLGAASSNQSDYLEFDHLTFEGRMEGGENLDGFTYHHNIAKCPNIGTGGGNQAPIYLQEMNREMHKDIHIYNNLFLIDSSCDLPPSNLQFIVAFSFNGAIIENNDFVNMTSKPMFAFVYLKRANKDTVVRYNWFRGSKGDPLGVWLMDCNGDSSLNEFGDRSDQGGSPDCNNKVYQNLFVGISSGAQCRSESGRHEWIYNNTIVDPGRAALGSTLTFREVVTAIRSSTISATVVLSPATATLPSRPMAIQAMSAWSNRPISTITSTGRPRLALRRGRTAESTRTAMAWRTETNCTPRLLTGRRTWHRRGWSG